MSLISLTFGDRKNNFSVSPEIQVTRPSDSIKVDPSVENKFEVVKSSFFFQQNEPYIVGNIVSGVVAQGMRGKVNGRNFEIVELDSKYGSAGIAKEGMSVGISVNGLGSELIGKGTIIVFEQGRTAAQ